MPLVAGTDRAGDAAGGVRDRRALVPSAGALVAAGIVLGIEFANPTQYVGPRAEATFETVVTLLVGLTTVLLAARFAHTRSLRDLLLFAAALSLGLTYLCGCVLPLPLGSDSEAWLTDFMVCSGVATAALFAGVARPGAGKVLDRVRRPLLIAGVCVALGVAVDAVGAALLADSVSSVSGRRGTDVQPMIHHPVLALLIVVGAALFLVPAIALLRTRRGQAEHMLLPAALILLSAAQLGHLAMPVAAQSDVIVSDGLRLIAVVLLLAIAVTEAARTRAATAAAAAVEERRRLARDLHDGLAQDLAFIAAHEARIAEALGRDHPVVRAAQRALTLSRGAISELSDAPGASVEHALEAVAAELSERFGVEVLVDVRLDPEPAARVREHLSRITREAITNAARHGEAGTVLVTVTGNDDALRLRIRDDGWGLSRTNGRNPTGGFGLVSISERAAAIGGSLDVQQIGDRGTLLQVSVP